METLQSKARRIEEAVYRMVNTGRVSELEARQALYALHLAGYDFIKDDPF